ncbi:24049_t:CDS:2 [Dentiscutata erythropus]|uniref:24049_t:CDS:1 n=1 Tax=Dentiscutata erythropus TaxID=1348616 RepID=A0A9N9EWA3_9GLOM|nr:24049_t:CDS:2 [Dentiscutata erythropus]
MERNWLLLTLVVGIAATIVGIATIIVGIATIIVGITTIIVGIATIIVGHETCAASLQHYEAALGTPSLRPTLKQII